MHFTPQLYRHQYAIHALNTQILEGNFIAIIMLQKVRKTTVRHIIEVLCEVKKRFQTHKYKGNTQEKALLYLIQFI